MKIPLSWPTRGLIGLNVTLAGVFVWRLLEPVDIEKKLAAIEISAQPVPAPVSASSPALVNYQAIRDAAVFYSVRRLYVEPPPDPMQAAPPPQYAFVAAMVQGDSRRSVAYLRRFEGQPAVKVRVGETLEGWTVRAIERRRVVLELGDRQQEILPAVPGNGGAALSSGLPTPLTEAPPQRSLTVAARPTLGGTALPSAAQASSPLPVRPSNAAALPPASDASGVPHDPRAAGRHPTQAPVFVQHPTRRQYLQFLRTRQNSTSSMQPPSPEIK